MERTQLIKLRLELGKTQKELADNLGISAVYVRKIEKGDVDPGRNTILKYVHFFAKDMTELFPDIFFNINDKKCIKTSNSA
ncbi:hypothetical protein DH09_08435 [Bacillaceae bacterium JMAK1]|nr:hypothetical protein DH09_08435 [Bacillaceae bacterium JMAK1]